MSNFKSYHYLFLLVSCHNFDFWIVFYRLQYDPKQRAERYQNIVQKIYLNSSKSEKSQYYRLVDNEDNWYSCKSCHRKFGYILKHLAQSTKCKVYYTDEEISSLRKKSSYISNKNMAGL